ncbi:MAG TPA: hypothetical protein VFV38_43310 [Ktedonobacteraceae bacterium]|nr:hypothetical protein [Ktedonobacteraceae bacterium]
MSVIDLDLVRPLRTLCDLEGIAGVLEVNTSLEETHLTTFKTHRANEVMPRLLAQFPDLTMISSLTVSEPHLDEVFLHLTGAAVRDEGGTA